METNDTFSRKRYDGVARAVAALALVIAGIALLIAITASTKANDAINRANQGIGTSAVETASGEPLPTTQEETGQGNNGNLPVSQIRLKTILSKMLMNSCQY